MFGLSAGQNEPTSHVSCVAEVDAVGQYEPALQPPDTADRPVALQKYPAVHNVKADRPVVLQKAPIGLSV